MIKRHISASLLEALGDNPVVLLHGARQTGKSTLTQWLASNQHPSRYLTLDDEVSWRPLKATRAVLSQP